MSDYKFMLESHLSAEQNRALTAVQNAAADVGLSLFLTGGAMRDMLGGFPIRDLDFTVEGNALKFVKTLEKLPDVRVVSVDDNRKSAELIFPGPVTVEIAMARQEKYAKPASKPKVTPATIHEDLRCRDFTINAMALSLNKASLGLLLDPTNGQADLERRELRIVSNYALYDDPGRVLRMIRLKVRMGFTLEERTQNQLANVREAELLDKIPTEVLHKELLQMAQEMNPGQVLEALEQEGLLKLFSPALTGPKLNSAGFAKLQKARQQVPFGTAFQADMFALFLDVLLEKLVPKERAGLLKNCAITKADLKVYDKLQANAKKLERALKSAKLKKPSLIYQALRDVPGEEVLYVLAHSAERLVVDRIKNYLQKYLQMAEEVTAAEIEAEGLKPGTPKFEKRKQELIAKKLDARPKKVVVEEPPPPAPAPILGRAPREQARARGGY
jgi:tRNA nucleotidyltransferase/poly(A) polymerase